MPNTYTQLHIHFIFATKYRNGSIHSDWQEDLHKYITGIVQNKDHKMLAINSMTDHLHMLLGMSPYQSISSLMQTVKSESSKWIMQKGHRALFAWQEGYGAFSISKSQVPGVILYIQNQNDHHRKKTFREEYLHLLENYGIDFDEKYIFIDPI